MARDDPPDAIVLEASGVADPRGIAQIALANPALRLDAIITLVDAETFAGNLSDDRARATLIAQLSAADIVVINKIDLAGAGTAAVRRTIETIAPERIHVEATQGSVPTDIILGTVNRGSSPFACLPAEHIVGFSSTTRCWEGPVDRETIMRSLRDLPAYVIRAKGTFSFAADPSTRFVYQRVGRRETLEPLLEASSIEEESRLVLIGFSNAWDEAEMSALLTDCGGVSL